MRKHNPHSLASKRKAISMLKSGKAFYSGSEGTEEDFSEVHVYPNNVYLYPDGTMTPPIAIFDLKELCKRSQNLNSKGG